MGFFFKAMKTRNNIIYCHDYDGIHRDVALGIKKYWNEQNYRNSSIYRYLSLGMAEDMANSIRSHVRTSMDHRSIVRALVIPMIGYTGVPTYITYVAESVAKNLRNTKPQLFQYVNYRLDLLSSLPRESIYMMKQLGKPVTPEDLRISLNVSIDLLKEMYDMIFVVDNVCATGTSAAAVLNVMPSNTHFVVYAMDKRF